MERLNFLLRRLPLAIAILAITTPAAMAADIGQLNSFKLQQLGRDLVRSPSEDFFQQGQRQLEREIQLLNRRQQFLDEQLLKVSADLRLQPQFSELEAPLQLPPSSEFSAPVGDR